MKKLIIPASLIIIGFLIYLNTLHAEFIPEWDDYIYVVNNSLIKSLDLGSIYKIFTAPHYTDYYPLQILSYAVDHRIWGSDPFGYRLTNLLIHILNSILVYILFSHLLNYHTILKRKGLIAAFGALIFLGHPTNLESVAWITERKNLLSMTFYILSFHFFARYKFSKRRAFYDISLVTFLFALLSKSSVVVLPLLLFLYDLVFFNKKEAMRTIFFEKAPFFILAAVFSVITILIQSNIGALYDHPKGQPIYTFFTMLKVIISYLRNSFFPVNLSPIYATVISESLIEPSVLSSISAFILVLAVAIYIKSKSKLMFFCILLFFIPLIPVLQFIPIAVYMADRYLYLPMLGFSLMMPLLLHKFLESFSSRGDNGGKMTFAYILFSILIVYQFSILTIRQGTVWENGIAVWGKVVRENPQLAPAYLGLGLAYMQKNQDKDAFAYITKALEIGLSEKQQKDAYYYRAIALIFHGDFARGERELERLKKIDAHYPLLFYGFGMLHLKSGNLEKADEELQLFLKIYKPPYMNFEDQFIENATAAIKWIEMRKVAPKRP